MEHNFNNIEEIRTVATELIARGKKLNLHVCIELNFTYDYVSIVVYTRDANGSLDDAIYRSYGNGRGINAESAGDAFAKLDEFFTSYAEDTESRLTHEVSKLTKDLSRAKSELKRIKNSKSEE